MGTVRAERINLTKRTVTKCTTERLKVLNPLSPGLLVLWTCVLVHARELLVLVRAGRINRTKCTKIIHAITVTPVGTHMFCACLVHAWLLHASCLFCAGIEHAHWRMVAIVCVFYVWFVHVFSFGVFPDCHGVVHAVGRLCLCC